MPVEMASALERPDTDNTACCHGGLVAFEGPADVVSTQLRLLPPSSQVLILPDLEHYMKKADNKGFSARSYVKEVHEAAHARNKVALQFLSDSSRGNKRLVFLNGGTAGAISQCISYISYYQTAGDSLHAEMILQEVLRQGVQGFEVANGKGCNDLVVSKAESVCSRDAVPWEDEEEMREDPITRAMRAADALYKETESLEPIECYIRTRPRSLSFPAPGWMDGVGQASPFFMIGSPPNEEVELEEQIENDISPSRRRTTIRASTNCSGMTIPMAYRPSSSTSRACLTLNNTNKSHTRNQSSTSNTLMSPPISPLEVEFGEARVVQVQALKKAAQTLRRTRSLDDKDLHRARMRRRADSNPLPVPTEEAPAPASQENKNPCRHLSILEDPFSNNNLIRLPRAKFVRANTTTVRKSPTFSKSPYDRLSHPHAAQDDKPEDEKNKEEIHSEVNRDPILPFLEDLVIQFTGEVSNHVLDSVIESLKSGLYPISTLPVDYEGTAGSESCPSTPRTADLFDEEYTTGLPPVAEVPISEEAGDCDAYSMSGISRASNFRFQSPCPSLPPEVQPPTPAHTPPILGIEADVKRPRFQVVSTTDRVNAIAIQNNLRSIIDAQFPPEQDRRYRLSRYSLIPQMDKLWRPMFWNAGTKGRISSERTADLILAIGAQNSVKSEVVSALTGQVEKLGSKSTGMTRSGRLDLRFLVANAMQSFTTQSLAHQLQENPFASPHLLACLIVPHLATYLSVNASTRFLILEYPAEHLGIVVALQKLIGTDALKIAGIIDSEAASAYNTEPPSPVSSYHGWRMSSSSITSIAAAQLAKSLDAASLPGSPFPYPFSSQNIPGAGLPALGHQCRLSFSKANYVLTNTATESEITSFINAIWKILIQADSFYVPEHGTHGSNNRFSGHHRFPVTKASNTSLGSSKFPCASTAPSTPPSLSPGAASSIINHGYLYWGLAGSLVSPPSSRGSGAGGDEQRQQMALMTSSPRQTVVVPRRSVENFHYTPPLVPIPPQPPSVSSASLTMWPSRDESPSGSSLRSARSRGRGAGTVRLSVFPNTATSSPGSSPASVELGLGVSLSAPLAAAAVPPSPTPTPAVGGGGGFSLRSRGLNRILASRKTRKVTRTANHHDGGLNVANLKPPTSSPPPPTTAAPRSSSASDVEYTTVARKSLASSLEGPDTSPSYHPVLCRREVSFLDVPSTIPVRGAMDSYGHATAAVAKNHSHLHDSMSAYALSLADEGEFYDDEERRLMPMYMRQNEIRKGNSRKALKWLGLA